MCGSQSVLDRATNLAFRPGVSASGSADLRARRPAWLEVFAGQRCSLLRSLLPDQSELRFFSCRFWFPPYSPL